MKQVAIKQNEQYLCKETVISKRKQTSHTHTLYSNNHTQFLKFFPYPMSKFCSLCEVQFRQERPTATQQKQGLITPWATCGEREQDNWNTGHTTILMDVDNYSKVFKNLGSPKIILTVSVNQKNSILISRLKF